MFALWTGALQRFKMQVLCHEKVFAKEPDVTKGLAHAACWWLECICFVVHWSVGSAVHCTYIVMICIQMYTLYIQILQIVYICRFVCCISALAVLWSWFFSKTWSLKAKRNLCVAGCCLSVCVCVCVRAKKTSCPQGDCGCLGDQKWLGERRGHLSMPDTLIERIKSVNRTNRR